MTNRQQARSHMKRRFSGARCKKIDCSYRVKDKGRVSEERIDNGRAEKKGEERYHRPLLNLSNQNFTDDVALLNILAVALKLRPSLKASLRDCFSVSLNVL